MRHLTRKAVPVAPAAPIGSLAAALAAVPDGRAPYGWRPGRSPLPLVAVLQVSVAALLCGAQSLAAIAQWSHERREDAPELLVALGLPAGRTPSVATLHRLFKTLDVEAFEHALGQWLRPTGMRPSAALAVDGKTLRGAARGAAPGVPGAHLVAVYTHHAHEIMAQVASAGKGHELAAAQQVLAQAPLAGRVVTADALATRAARCATRWWMPRETMCCQSKTISPRSWPIARRPFPLWTATGFDGSGMPRAPIWRRREMTARGGVLRHGVSSEPKARHGRHELRLRMARWPIPK